MKGIKEAFIDAGEISQMLGIGMTKAYASNGLQGATSGIKKQVV